MWKVQDFATGYCLWNKGKLERVLYFALEMLHRWSQCHIDLCNKQLSLVRGKVEIERQKQSTHISTWHGPPPHPSGCMTQSWSHPPYKYFGLRSIPARWATACNIVFLPLHLFPFSFSCQCVLHELELNIFYGLANREIILVSTSQYFFYLKKAASTFVIPLSKLLPLDNS